MACLPGHSALLPPLLGLRNPAGAAWLAWPTQLPENMWAQHRFLALAAALVLLLAIAVADEPPTSPDPTSPASSQAPEPASAEPSVPGKAEASGESEIATPLEQLTTGMPPVSFAGEDRSHTDDVNRALLNSDASSLGSFSLEPLPGEAQSGPSMETPSHSHESQESLDRDVDSEESLASQGM